MNRVDQLLFLPVVNVETPSRVVLQRNVAGFEATAEDLRRSPLAGNHDVEMRLIPEVIAANRRLALCPRANTLKVLVEQDEVAFRISLGIAHRGDHNVAIRQAVRRVRCANVVFSQNLTVDDLVKLRPLWVSPDVENEAERKIDKAALFSQNSAVLHRIRLKARQNELVALRSAALAAAASVPSDVVELLALHAGIRAVDHLAVRLAFRVHVNH